MSSDLRRSRNLADVTALYVWRLGAFPAEIYRRSFTLQTKVLQSLQALSILLWVHEFPPWCCKSLSVRSAEEDSQQKSLNDE